MYDILLSEIDKIWSTEVSIIKSLFPNDSKYEVPITFCTKLENAQTSMYSYSCHIVGGV